MVLPEAAILSNVPCLAMARADKQPGGARLKRQPVIIVRTQQNNSSASSCPGDPQGTRYEVQSLAVQQDPRELELSKGRRLLHELGGVPHMMT